MLPLLLALCTAGPEFAQQNSQPSEMQRAVEEFRTLTREMGLRPESRRRKRGDGGARPQWHGRVFENFRNDFLDAVPHEIRQGGSTKSLLRRNQFGFNIAGPVVIPKLYNGNSVTYFSLTFEGVRERVSRSLLRTVPTLAEHSGDYSAVVDSSGVVLPIYDPRTTRINPAFDPSWAVSTGNLQHLRDRFPGNIIPEYRIDPVARKALTFYPVPNAAVGPYFQNNYFVVSPETNVANGLIGKVDHAVRDRQRISFNFSYSNGLIGTAKLFPTAADPSGPDRDFSSRHASLEHVFTKSSQTVNTLSFGANSSGSRTGTEERINYASEIGLRGSSDLAFPVFRLAPYVWMGRSFPASKNMWNTFSVSDGFSTRRGKHYLRLRVVHTRFQVNTFWPQYPAGSLRFGAGLTSLPGIVNTGHAFASFLLGLADYAESSVVLAPSYFRKSFSSVMLTDRYELSRGFQFSFGLELNYNGARTEKFDRYSNIDLQAVNPVNGRPGALVVAARDGRGQAFQPSLVKLEPNAGISWSPRGDPKTVVRLSYWRSYPGLPLSSGQWGTQAFNGSPTYLSPNIQLEPAVILSDGIPPPSNSFPDLRPEAANDTIADLIDTTDRQPTNHWASLSFERELPAALVLRLGASYSGGKNQLVDNNTGSPNSIPVAALRYRDMLNDEAFNRSLRPYPQYKGFELNGSYPLGRFQRRDFNVRLEKRASQGLTLNMYYEFSRQMDDYSGPMGRQDVYDRESEWARTRWSRPHALSLSYVYELPLGTSKPFLSFSDWRRHLANGWSLSGMTSVSSGEPLAVVPMFNNTGGVVRGLRVNVVPGVDAAVANPGPDLWFNPAAFEQPPDFTLGNASRTHPSLLAPGGQNHDLSVNKRFALTADRTVELSAVGLNFLNHANWNDPDVQIGSASSPNTNAGKIIGSRGGRVIQLGLRFSF